METGPIAGISTVRLHRVAKLNQNVQPTPFVEAGKEVNDSYHSAQDESRQDSKTPNESKLPANDDDDERGNWTAAPYDQIHPSRGPAGPRISYFV